MFSKSSLTMPVTISAPVNRTSAWINSLSTIALSLSQTLLTLWIKQPPRLGTTGSLLSSPANKQTNKPKTSTTKIYNKSLNIQSYPYSPVPCFPFQQISLLRERLTFSVSKSSLTVCNLWVLKSVNHVKVNKTTILI